MSVKKANISLTLDTGLLCEIDKRRGLIPRSAFVENELINSMKVSKDGSE